MEHYDSRATDEPEEFPGFEQARQVMWHYEIRARVPVRLALTDLLDDPEISAIHVETTDRVDRHVLTAFDCTGCPVAGDTLYVDEPAQRLEIAPEFDSDFTKLVIPADSALARLASRETGWIINLEALREYDPIADRRATQRKVMLCHLQDMLGHGDAQGFIFQQSQPTLLEHPGNPEDDPEAQRDAA